MPPAGFLLSRIARPPSGSAATSTQLPPLAEEYELFFHARSFIACAPYFPDEVSRRHETQRAGTNDVNTGRRLCNFFLVVRQPPTVDSLGEPLGWLVTVF